MDTGLNINVELVNEKVQLRAVSELRPDTPVMFDYEPPVGDGQGFLGLEMLLMSFAGCVSTAIVALLHRTGKPFSKYRMDVTGYRREKPLSLEKIEAVVSFLSDEITQEETASILRIAENISPVWIAIRNNVDVTMRSQINRS